MTSYFLRPFDPAFSFEPFSFEPLSFDDGAPAEALPGCRSGRSQTP